jgi:uncharacterized membrane protein YdjX (TVP38/TMEM64 family)
VVSVVSIAGLAAFWLSPWGAFLRDRAVVQGWVEGFGPWAPLVGVLLGIVQVLGLPMPATVMAVTNGYLFGPVMGALIGLVGGTLGGALGVVVARRLGRPFLGRVLGAEGLAWLDHYAGQRSLVYAAIFAFLIPGVPDNVIFFAVGLSGRPALPILGLALVIRLPAMLLLPYIGSGLPGLGL